MSSAPEVIMSFSDVAHAIHLATRTVRIQSLIVNN